MANSEDKMQFIPLIAGLFVVSLLSYVAIVLIPTEYQIYLYVFIALFFVSIAIIVYFSIKNSGFRKIIFSSLNKTLLSISKLGHDVLSKEGEGKQNKQKKKDPRIPPPTYIKNQVRDIAGDRCQYCGKRGYLEIHHIDGEPSNNDIKNLILLCENHHGDADKGVIPKDRLKYLRKKRKMPDNISQ